MIVASTEEESGSDAVVALGAGDVGPIRALLRAAFDEARESKALDARGEVHAALAERFADVADRAAAAGDDAKFERAAARVASLVDRLIPGVSGGELDGNDDRGDERVRVLRALDGPPTVGDAKNA